MASAIHDPQPGTAPGLICPIGDKVIYAVPGVPHEMRTIVSSAIVPDLRARAGEPSVIMSRVLRTWGESESRLAELLDDRIQLLDRRGNPTLAFLASGIEGLKVRITAKAVDESTAVELLDAEEAELRGRLGQLVFGVDDENMEHAVAALLDAQGLTLALAESVTGGLMGARITDVEGASEFFKGSIVSYDSDVKFSVLDVPEGPVVSAAAAEAMASGARRVLGVRCRTCGHRGCRTSRAGWPTGGNGVHRHRDRRRRRAGRAASAGGSTAHPRVHGHLRARPVAPAVVASRKLKPFDARCSLPCGRTLRRSISLRSWIGRSSTAFAGPLATSGTSRCGSSVRSRTWRPSRSRCGMRLLGRVRCMHISDRWWSASRTCCGRRCRDSTTLLVLWSRRRRCSECPRRTVAFEATSRWRGSDRVERARRCEWRKDSRCRDRGTSTTSSWSAVTSGQAARATRRSLVCR